MDNKVLRKGVQVSGGNLPDGFKVKLNVEIDYTGVDRATLMQWATSDRIIAFQRIRETASTRELNEMAKDTVRIHATQCGKKVKSREERIEEIKALGVPKPIAILMVDDPEKAKELLGKVNQ